MQAPARPNGAITTGDVHNAIIPALEAAGIEIEDHSVNERGLTIWIAGYLVKIKFEPVHPGVYILEDGTIYSR